jgi:hypothetical protein
MCLTGNGTAHPPRVQVPPGWSPIKSGGGLRKAARRECLAEIWRSQSVELARCDRTQGCVVLKGYRSQMLETFSPLTSCLTARIELRKIGGTNVRTTER